MVMSGSDGFSDTFEIIVSNLTTSLQETDICVTAEQNATWACMGYGAAICRLFPCVRTYKAEQRDGRLKETRLSSSATWADWDPLHSQTTVNVPCLSQAEVTSLRDIGYVINNMTKWLGFKAPGYFANWTDITLREECLYRIYSETIQSFETYMSSFFNGTISSSYDYNSIEGPVQLQKFFNSGNISFDYVNTTLANIADSMTAYIQQSAMKGTTRIPVFDNDNYLPALGKVFQSTTCVSVRWGYFALPAAIVASTLVFLVAMIVQTTSRANGRDWKSSPLALLFHGLDPSLRSQLSFVERLDEMERTAKQLGVQLKRTEKGWQFVEASWIWPSISGWLVRQLETPASY